MYQGLVKTFGKPVQRLQVDILTLPSVLPGAMKILTEVQKFLTVH